MPYLHRVQVQPEDIDRLGHAGNQVYLRWVLEAALAHSTALGLPEEAYLARGQAWVVRRHELSYLRPALPGEALQVETRVASMSAASSVRRTRVVRSGEVLCEAATDWVYVELARGRPVRIPEDIRFRFPLEP
jgi:acyl-CoA thioester hydrolase